MKFEIEITKEIIEKSMYCGTNFESAPASIVSNCAFALAYCELFPGTLVGTDNIFLYTPYDEHKIPLTDAQAEFVKEFDSVGTRALLGIITKEELETERFALVGEKFQVEIPDTIIDEMHPDHVQLAEHLANLTCIKTVA